MRLEGVAFNEIESIVDSQDEPEGEDVSQEPVRKPIYMYFNLLLTAVLMVFMIMDIVPLAVIFMVAFAIAIVVNYPRLEDQQEVIRKYADNALSVSAMIFAAGIFTGILTGTRMMDAMAGALINAIPEQWGSHLPLITGLATPALTFFMSNDAFYFGILPLVGQTAQHLGVSLAEVARASLFGGPIHLLSPLVPSTYLLVGLAGVSFADHLYFTLKWASMTCLVGRSLSLWRGLVLSCQCIKRKPSSVLSI